MKRNMTITNKLAAIGLAAATLLGSTGMVGVAFADDGAHAPAGNGTFATDLTVKTQNTDPNTNATLKGRTLKAYKIASYVDPSFNDQNQVTGYDLKIADGVNDADVRAAIKAAVTDADGNVSADWSDLVSVGQDGAVTFVNDAASLSSVQFVAKYFYGTGADVYTNDHADKAEIRKFADAMKGKSGTGVDMSVSEDGSQATLDVADADLGVYLIVDETPNAGDGAIKDQTVSFAMLAGTVFNNNGQAADTVHSTDHNTDYKAGEIVIKADKVTVAKDEVGDKGLVGIGSTRTFQIDTNVPNYKQDFQNFKSAKFVIKDNPTDGIRVSKAGDYSDVEGLKVQANTGADGAYADLTKDTDYTVSAQADTQDPNDWQITLTDPTAWSGKKIRVTYDATVTDLINETSNSASVEYSNDPSSDTTIETDKTTERQYEGDIDLSKWDLNDNSLALAGAQFQVYAGDAKQGTPLTFLKAESKDDQQTVTDTDYKFVSDDAHDALGISGRTDTIDFGTLSKVAIRGLAADSKDAVTYHFVETKAPAGYLLGGSPVEFNVTLTPNFAQDGELESVKYTVDAGSFAKFLDMNNLTDGATVNVPATDSTRVRSDVKVENTKSASDLAKTGADILTYLALTGAAAVLGGGLVVAARRRAAVK